MCFGAMLTKCKEDHPMMLKTVSAAVLAMCALLGSSLVPNVEPDDRCGHVDGYKCESHFQITQVPLPTVPGTYCVTFTFVPDSFGNGNGICECDAAHHCAISSTKGCAGSGTLVVTPPIGSHLKRASTGECVNGPGSISAQITWGNSKKCPWPTDADLVNVGSHAEFEVRTGDCDGLNTTRVCGIDFQGACYSCAGSCPQ
jgi:hypothetical protein